MKRNDQGFSRLECFEDSVRRSGSPVPWTGRTLPLSPPHVRSRERHGFLHSRAVGAQLHGSSCRDAVCLFWLPGRSSRDTGAGKELEFRGDWKAGGGTGGPLGPLLPSGASRAAPRSPWRKALLTLTLLQRLPQDRLPVESHWQTERSQKSCESFFFFLW